ncbi:pseudouridine synthase [Microdochium trichocladiopsis]|uniref:tRNA pseudouridine synthase 1 n=1 Tax=Microdochium trichocladiopsis TaxID=1682393 RepID=A0A9P9BUQ1_9PEZI|nr:pseudouridine synthase [Microdochium trichocladiopsis]KAH7037871.1 pseudouridine synthase [Microdochium trichocladiopsis]
MWQQKRRKVDEDGNSVPLPATGPDGEQSYMRIQFSEAEIAAEERRPKRKVAVLIGYAGTGYHGLQINHKEKTIEGDIFAAFVAAKAIAKTNADDPRKSSFVRCARTDKGVHAAGNMVSLKLIIEDPDVVQKINDNLPPQIRVWGITRTNNAFSSYQSCDSRWYEYLMPSYCLLPPHIHSFLGKKVAQYAKDNGYEGELAKRLEDVQGFWEEVEKNDIQPIMDSLEESVREAVLAKLHAVREGLVGDDGITDDKAAKKKPAETQESEPQATEEAAPTAPTEELTESTPATTTAPTEDAPAAAEEATTAEAAKDVKPVNPVEQALKRISAAYIAAKRRYRVTPGRLAQLQEALDQYVGTRNYHNYTVQKSHGDPSAKRLIKSFQLNKEPVQINDTQWLSLKVHGQSFMMHQIRKMVGMAVLVTRCGTPLGRIEESYGPTRISIPKAPGLGLLLERPVFDSYNARAKDMYNLEPLDFGNYEKEIQKFKEEQIYQRIFELEEQQNSFHTFFHQVDNFKSDYFLWVTAGGLEAAQHRPGMKGRDPAAFTGDDDEGEDDDAAAAAKGGEGNEG